MTGRTEEIEGGVCLEIGDKRWWFPVGYDSVHGPQWADALLAMRGMNVPDFKIMLEPSSRKYIRDSG